MTKKQKVNIITAELERLFPNPEPALEYKNAFTFLVAVMLSAQSTDKGVNKVTPKLFSLADNAKDMAKLTWQQVLDIIRPVGLAPTKAKNIALTAKMLSEKYGGRVPETLDELEGLPGVGHKTASVIVSQFYGGEAFPVDTHIHRMMERWGLSNGKNVVQSEKDAKALFPKELWRKLHLQIILYARQYSPAMAWKKEEDVIYNLLNPKHP